MSDEFFSVWVEDQEVPGRWLNAYGFAREQAQERVAELVEKGRRAILTPFGQVPKCRECGEFTDEADQICDACKEALSVVFVREVA